MVGIQTYDELRKVELEANRLGFDFQRSKHHREFDGIALYPKDDALPIYARDAELWFADLTGVKQFLAGFRFAINYHLMLGFTDSKIKRKEQDVRNRQLANRIKDVPSGAITK